MVEGLLVVGCEIPHVLDSGARHRLEQGVVRFCKVIEHCPGHWQSLWLLGKIHQRLGAAANAFQYFCRASDCNPGHPDILREAAIAAQELGLRDEAVAYNLLALQANPGDAGLLGNLALALLFDERIHEARNVAARARILDPTDGTLRRLIAIIDDVIQEKRACPHHVRDLQ